MSRAHHMPASPAAQPALSVPVPRLPLPQLPGLLCFSDVCPEGVSGQHRGPSLTCGTKAPYPDLILIFQVIASPHPPGCDLLHPLHGYGSVFLHTLILPQAESISGLSGLDSGTLYSSQPLHVCSPEALPGPLRGTQVSSLGLTCSLNLPIMSELPPFPLCVTHVCLPRSPPQPFQILLGSSTYPSPSQHPPNVEPRATESLLGLGDRLNTLCLRCHFGSRPSAP